MQKLRLQTFGGARITGDDGPLGGAAAQRRTLALLSILAIAGPAGVSRDKLLSLLWPETDADRARHSLTQALYSARRSLNADDMVVGSADLRLNDDVLSSDVRDFEVAIDAGDLARAAELYEGPFLDGFFVSGSTEFEQWSSAQRARLEAMVVTALESLATQAEQARDSEQAVRWRRRLAAIRPLDSAVVSRLMIALASAGDRAAAIQQARIHEVMLREQVDLDPDPVIIALAARLREPGDWQPTLDAPQAVNREDASDTGADPPAVREVPDTPAHAHDAPLARGSIGVWVPAPRHRRWGARAVVLGMAAALVTLGVIIGRGRGAPEVTELPIRQRVVVAPFRIAGAEPSLSYLRDGMVELLSSRLADDSVARSVDAGAVLGAWRTARMTAAMDMSRDTIVRLASRLGAERVVIGSVVGARTRLVIEASVLGVPDGTLNAQATVTGPIDSLTSLIDQLAVRLLAIQAGEDEDFARHTTSSLPALRAYLMGQTAFRDRDYMAAIRQYSSALRHDSTFALAALQIVTSGDRLLDDEQTRRGIALAWPHRAQLGARDHALLRAFSGPRYPAPSAASEHLAAWQAVVDLAPGSAESWYSMGARLWQDGAAVGIANPAARAGDAFQRALDIDQGITPARDLLALARPHAATAAAGPADTLGHFAPLVRWRRARASGDTATVHEMSAGLFRLGPANLRAIAMTSLFEQMGLDDGARALELLGARATRGVDQSRVLLAAHSLAMSRGQLRRTQTITSQLRRAQPGAYTAIRLRVLDALYAEGDTATARAAAGELATFTGSDPSASTLSSEMWGANACVLSQWQLSRRDTAGVRARIATLRERGLPPSTSLGGGAPAPCVALLDAWLAVLTRAPDSRSRLVQIDSLVFTPQVSGDVATYAHLLVSRLHRMLGDNASALTAVRRRPYMSGWPRYLATALGEEARLAESMGDIPGARDAYRRYLALRDDPDVELSATLAEVRGRLERLEAANTGS